MSEEILCLSCRHRRVAAVPEPSCVSDTTNRKRVRNYGFLLAARAKPDMIVTLDDDCYA